VVAESAKLATRDTGACIFPPHLKVCTDDKDRVKWTAVVHPSSISTAASLSMGLSDSRNSTNMASDGKSIYSSDAPSTIDLQLVPTFD